MIEIAQLKEERDSISFQSEDVVAEYYILQQQLMKLKKTIRDTVNQPIHALPYLQPGRLVKVITVKP